MNTAVAKAEPTAPMRLLQITDAEWTVWDARCRQELKKATRTWRQRTPEEREYGAAAKRYYALERRCGPPAVGYDLALPGMVIVDYNAGATIGRRETA